jgi:hypothetical protein
LGIEGEGEGTFTIEYPGVRMIGDAERSKVQKANGNQGTAQMGTEIGSKKR